MYLYDEEVGDCGVLFFQTRSLVVGLGGFPGYTTPITLSLVGHSLCSELNLFTQYLLCILQATTAMNCLLKSGAGPRGVCEAKTAKTDRTNKTKRNIENTRNCLWGVFLVGLPLG